MSNGRRPLVAGNWKMHGNLQRAAELATAVSRGALPETVDVVVCPPLCHLGAVAGAISATRLQLGAQDVAPWVEDGAYTGEVSSPMLKDAGCGYAIVGHSERRGLLAENDATVAQKFMAAQAGGITPILCVGETLAEREAGKSLDVVGAQLQAVIDAAGISAFTNAVLAYEPVWAIGTGRTAAAGDAQEVHQHLRCLAGESDATITGSLRILYGGSVKPGNAAELFAQADIDGGLIGGAALQADDFLAIVQAAANT